MACCGRNKTDSGRIVRTTSATASGTKTTQFVIASAKNWLPFPTNTAPPGGWSGLGFDAKGPEELAQKVAQQRVAEKRFTSLKEVYKEIVHHYCSRPGSPCGRNYSG